MAQQTNVQRSFKQMLDDQKVQEKFQKMLGDNSTSFLMSVMNCVNNNDKLQSADPQSILMASAVAGSLGLPVDPNLGQAYIIPYNVKVKGQNGEKDTWVTKAQFQIGYKGLIQLGHRSQQFLTMNSTEVREGEYVGVDRMTGEHQFDWIQDNDERDALPIVGFVAFFKLTNGFSKSMYMTAKQMNAHGAKYSKTFSQQYGRWKVDFIGMGKKTILKLLIDKYAPKSVEMQKAITTDQAIVNDFEGDQIEYPDNKQTIDVEEIAEQNLLELETFFNSNDFDLSEEDVMNVERIIKQKESLSYSKAMDLLKKSVKNG